LNPLLESPLAVVALICAGCSAAILIVYLIRRPALERAVKIWLLFGLGVFPLGVAFAGNIQGFEATKKRHFCGSCHVMVPHASDSNWATSLSLSSRHARNKLFGDENCYGCHADYGMFGTVVTKMGGMRHVWLYYTEYRKVSIEEARETIHLLKPYPNDNCMQCHSTEGKLWQQKPDHQATLEDVRSGRVSCASGGCHGYAHPNFRPPGEVAVAVDAGAAASVEAGGAQRVDAGGTF
jgi:nitrate/TMAO reductase-like tetraheme cytochrome c subunit